MSSKPMHYTAGVVIAGCAIYAGHNHFEAWQLGLLALGCLWGSSSPDWLEISGWLLGRRLSLIPHRTITHWLAGWVAVFGWVVWSTVTNGGFYWWLICGFTLSGLVHVLMDANTPMGVPILHPYKRTRGR